MSLWRLSVIKHIVVYLLPFFFFYIYAFYIHFTLMYLNLVLLKACNISPGHIYYAILDSLLFFHLFQLHWHSQVNCDLCFIVRGPAAAAAKSRQLCQTLCDPTDCSPPGSPVPGILQARTLEWVALSFCNAWKWKVKVKSLSRVRLLATPWTAAYQAPPSMGFSRQESCTDTMNYLQELLFP